eukprot:TRINITY_DN5217_c0_g1_i1.p1 TRINITY_DN5217_c0_g1~~TRINITY_DN5217_c0_g1_i1.p1  ORF type:complete len:120 (-),score=25.10 TRINITY_DN5217_c0_g1_i1:412-741(-)
MSSPQKKTKTEVFEGRRRFHDVDVVRHISGISRGSSKTYDRKSPQGGAAIFGGMNSLESKFLLDTLTDLASTPIVLLGSARLTTSESQKYLAEYYGYRRTIKSTGSIQE